MGRLSSRSHRRSFNLLNIEVGDIEAALVFYGLLFDLELRGKNESSAFIDLGDQLLALQNEEAVREALARSICGFP